MKNNLNFSKTVWCNKIKKTNFQYDIIHQHVTQWVFPFMLTAILSNRSSEHPNGPLIAFI